MIIRMRYTWAVLNTRSNSFLFHKHALKKSSPFLKEQTFLKVIVLALRLMQVLLL